MAGEDEVLRVESGIPTRRFVEDNLHAYTNNLSAVAVGDVVYQDSTVDSKVLIADSDTAMSNPPVGVVTEIVDTTNCIVCHAGGIVTGLSALTKGSVYYLSATGTTGNTLTTTRSVTDAYIVGVALSATELLVLLIPSRVGDVSTNTTTSIDNSLVRYHGASGYAVQGGASSNNVILDDLGNLSPEADDGGALGATGTKWSDLFLASGAVINFDNGDAVVTHSANALAFTGATSGYSFDENVKLPDNKAVAVGTDTDGTFGFDTTGGFVYVYGGTITSGAPQTVSSAIPLYLIASYGAAGIAGGSLLVSSGAGGTQAAGGVATLVAANGGDSTGTAAGGAGGSMTLGAGPGGAGHTVTHASGAGGTTKIYGGYAGTDLGGGTGVGGSLELDAGWGSTNGSIKIGTISDGLQATTSILLGNTTDNPPITQQGSGQVTFTGNVDMGSSLDVTGSVYIVEQAAALGDVAGLGQIWVKNDIPNTLYFTDDAGTDWLLNSSGGTGDVTGPGSSTDNALARFDLTTGKIIQNSGVTLDDTNNMLGLVSLGMTEQTSAPTPAAGSGYFWTFQPNGTGGGNLPYFTDDIGTDFGVQHTLVMERTFPTGGADSIELGNITHGASPTTFTLTVLSGASTSTDGAAVFRYLGHSSGTGGAWQILQPEYTTGPAVSGNHYNIQIEVNAGVTTLDIRARALGNSVSVTAKFRFVFDGSEDQLFVETSTQATTTAPTDTYVGSPITQSSRITSSGSAGAGAAVWFPLYMLERAGAELDGAGWGQFWVRNDSPNQPMFTTDTGSDRAILVNTTATTIDNSIVRFSGTGGGIAQGGVATKNVILSDTGVLSPETNNGGALGSTSLRWSDLFLGSNGVINWAAGDITITGNTNNLVFAGASLGYVLAGGSLFIQEAGAASADTAGYGQFWVENDAPNIPKFTDDAGTDFTLGYDHAGWCSVTILTSTFTATTSKVDLFASANYSAFVENTDWKRNVSDNIVTFDGGTSGIFDFSVAGTYKIDLTVYAIAAATTGLTISMEINSVEVFTTNTLIDSTSGPLERSVSIIKTVATAGHDLHVFVDSTTANNIDIEPGTTLTITRLS